MRKQFSAGEATARLARRCWLRVSLVVAACCVGAVSVAWGQGAAGVRDCSSVPHAEHPHARLTNGALDLLVFLPDKDRGYYRSSRFDWSGVIACATYKGHSYFGEWFDHYDPHAHDAVTGPVEEFRGTGGEIGYAEAAPGGLFVKVGVGVVRRLDDKPYDFKTVYPVVDSGKWTVHTSKRQIVFEQELVSPIGVSYRYRKTLSLEANSPVLHIEHRLTNTGNKLIDAEVYDHDFFMLDRGVTGPETKITFPFHPVFETPLPEAAAVNGDAIGFQRPLRDGEVLRGGYFGGFSGDVKDYTIRTENSETGTGVLQTASVPMVHAFFWATSRTVCPEAFVAVKVAAGARQDWTLTYRFLARN